MQDAFKKFAHTVLSMEAMAENTGGINEEKRLKEWIRAQETAFLGVGIREVKVTNNTVEIEGWLKSSEVEEKEYGVLMPLKKDSKNKYRIRMEEATHHCDDIKYRGAVVCRHVRALAIYIKEHFREIKKEYKLKGVNLA